MGLWNAGQGSAGDRSMGRARRMAEVPHVRLEDEQGRVLCEGAPESLPYGEKAILAGSMEFFRDPEPCFIHRGAVVTRFAAELEACLRTYAEMGIKEMDWMELPEDLRLRLAPAGIPSRLKLG